MLAITIVVILFSKINCSLDYLAENQQNQMTQSIQSVANSVGSLFWILLIFAVFVLIFFGIVRSQRFIGGTEYE